MKILHNRKGSLKLKSDLLFNNLGSTACREFINRVFSVNEVNRIRLDPINRIAAIGYENPNGKQVQVLRKISLALGNGKKNKKVNTYNSGELAGLDGNVINVSRFGNRLTTWEIKHEIFGRIRLKNPFLYRKKSVCQEIEKELLGTIGVQRYSTNPFTCSVLIIYDDEKIDKSHLIRVLDGVLDKSKKKKKKDKLDLDFTLNTASMGLAAVGQWLFPWTIPFNAGLVIYNAYPTYKGAVQAIRKKKIGVDILDSIIVTMCLVGGSVFAGALMNWCLSLGRNILSKTEDDSKKLLVEIFGKQPRFVWLYKNGQEIEVSLTELKEGDIIVVNTGETVPVDGEVANGTAMIDQHTLTGESAPVEKIKGDKVFASTVLLAGKVYIRVMQTGDQTTSAKIRSVLVKTAGYKVKAQSRGEKLADKAVIPTLAMSFLGYAISGYDASLAIVNCDYGTGIRMAAPLGLLSTLALCAREGILVKDGRALENLPRIDTFLFDKTGTLTNEIPEVSDVIVADGISKEKVLMFAAAAEEKFTHPIAKAIIEKAKELNLKLPSRDESRYHVGYGITVGIKGDTVKVGSARFMGMESIKIPREIEEKVEVVRKDGGSAVMVAINDKLKGVILLNTMHRSEAHDIIQGLRKRGVKEIVLISGDHEGPTKKLAEQLGMDRYFAEVLPREKGDYVKLLQKGKKKVAFVGDGINDSIALKRADVSISLKGASSIATDTAQIVFMDANIAKLTRLLDIAKELERNISLSWNMVAIPNTICIIGALTGAFGLTSSLILNNGANFLATLNGTRPLYKVYGEEMERMERMEHEKEKVEIA
ncbi:MAG: heavy metal translocating P-type ATPase [Candidatus Ancaeobacter aquaticus]|nr:heavy metal translocating P-type ATPase [Candidatus Ancaeobacter aquaticus]